VWRRHILCLRCPSSQTFRGKSLAGQPINAQESQGLEWRDSLTGHTQYIIKYIYNIIIYFIYNYTIYIYSFLFVYLLYIYIYIHLYSYIYIYSLYILYDHILSILYILRYYNTVLQCTVWFNMMFRLSETSGQAKPSVPHFRIASVGRCCSCVFYIFFRGSQQILDTVDMIFHGPEPNNSSAAEDVQPNSWVSRTARFLHFHRLFVCLCRLMVCPFWYISVTPCKKS